MKTRIFTILSILSFAAIELHAQNYQGINYQAIVRDSQGNLIKNADITAIISITTDSLGYNAIYKEQQQVHTSDYGSFSLIIGAGTVLSGTFSNIDWYNRYYVKLEIDQGTGATQVGVSPLTAVPYSYRSKMAEKATDLNMEELANVNATGTQEGDVLSWHSNNWINTHPDSVFWHNSKNSLLADPSVKNVGIGVDSAEAELHLSGGKWDLVNTEGDFKIGNDSYRLKMGVALGGAGAGQCRIFAAGGNNTLTLGAGGINTLSVVPGAVGINTYAPYAGLDIHYNSSVFYPQLRLTQPILQDFSRLTFANDPTDHFWTLAATSDTTNPIDPRFNFYYYNGSAGHDLITVNGNGGLGINDPFPNSMLTIYNSGKLYGGVSIYPKNGGDAWNINVDTTTNYLNFSRNFTVLGYIDDAGNYVQVSDRTLKTNIQKINDGLDKINDLIPSQYDMKSSGTHHYGFIAQDVEKVLPGVVESNQGYKTVSYSQIIPFTVAAIQEQQKEINELKQQLEDKNKALAQQEDRLNALEAQIQSLTQQINKNSGSKNLADNE